jgi:hypothetical protein
MSTPKRLSIDGSDGNLESIVYLPEIVPRAFAALEIAMANL